MTLANTKHHDIICINMKKDTKKTCKYTTFVDATILLSWQGRHSYIKYNYKKGNIYLNQFIFDSYKSYCTNILIWVLIVFIIKR